MPRPALSLLLCLAAAIACADGATQPVDPPHPPVDSAATRGPRASAVVLPACTRTWRTGVNGDWNIAANWTPSGVPTATDAVCLNPLKSAYIVTVSGLTTVSSITVNAPATLVATPPTGGTSLTASIGVLIGAGGEMQLGGGQALVTGALENDGTLTMNGTSAMITADSLNNVGTLQFTSGAAYPKITLLSSGIAFRNSGVIQLDAFGAWIDFLSRSAQARMTGGSLQGAGSGLFLTGRDSTVSSPRAEFRWSGGVLWAGMGNYGRLSLSGMDLTLSSSTLFGTVEIKSESWTTRGVTVTGDIGPDVTLQYQAIPYDPLKITFARQGGGPVRNQGIIEDGHVSLPPAIILAGKGLINEGRLTLGSSDTVELQLDSLVNLGTLEVEGYHRYPGNGRLLRNRGTVTVAAGGTLAMTGATFVAESGSTQSGALALSGFAVLSGNGTVGTVTSTGGQLEPTGTLHAGSVTLDPASGVGIDIAGVTPGSYDQLTTTGTLTMAGTLSVREVAPFVTGICGQLADIVPVPAARRSGAFGKFSGLTPSPTRGWRLNAAAKGLTLVGHNPALPVSVASGPIALTEGGAPATYPVCLRTAPTANVTVTPTSGPGLISAAPLVFTPAAWALPLTASVAAVDDATVESPATDQLKNAVTSSDPAYSGAYTFPIALTVADNDGNSDLSVNTLIGPPPLVPGQQFSVTFREQVLGPTLSTGATFNLSASAGYTYVSATGVLGCTASSVTGVTCDLAGAANGALVDFVLTLQAGPSGAYPLTLSITGQQPDTVPTNNSHVNTLTVQ